ncbi:response regulator transcription factor [Pinibacter soli]|uniref:Response regulator n=1 Tax=Pinibacter soli TaxID=3044211 RepID=A0ABT6RGP3_9BACT|nr:response regulator [Pinibacter soli]MDI3321017.1 response regulator [Pinibacter soli]
MKENKILIVEDNTELREFIKICLSPYYEFLETSNGKQGWEAAVAEIPDLIVTDVMMPEMDGNQFCRKLKSDERTSHIPVIMLTAKIAVEQQLEGLESGADIYLTKPFSVQILQSYISNLLKSREAIRQRYDNKVLLEPLEVEVGTVDKKFMERLMNVINENLSNADFNISDLSKCIGMSKAVLYKKFNALTQIPIGEFIKSLRLKKAAILLSKDKLNVAEVAWEVGFNDRKYFSKEFKKLFGKTPSEYIDRAKGEYE